MTQTLFPDAIFQHVNASIHTDRIVQRNYIYSHWFEYHSAVVVFRAYWKSENGLISLLPQMSKNWSDFFFRNNIESYWLHYHRDLYASIPKMIEAVNNGKGFPTPYSVGIHIIVPINCICVYVYDGCFNIPSKQIERSSNSISWHVFKYILSSMFFMYVYLRFLGRINISGHWRP